MTNAPAHLTDEQLLGAVQRLASRERDSTADLVAHFVELEARRLYLGAGFSSLYEYCREVLHLSEDRACNRIAAARAARNFPSVLPMLADGRLNLSTLRMLIPHLAEDHDQLLAAAAFKTRSELREVIARRAPRPDVATSVRKSPSLAVEPLAEDRYLIKFTAGAAMVTRLRQAQDLLRHAVPSGDAGEIFDRALTVLLEELQKRKFAATSRPRPGRPSRRESRDIPDGVKRAVWMRDEGQCSFAGGGGRRCEARAFLEFHHLAPYATGGAPSVENIALRCSAHNQYEADRYFAPIRADMSVHHSTRPGTG
jgi:hypothetical protein